MKLRFAPSPTGLLNVAHARLALATWLLARRNGGAALLRLDDADADRTRPEYIDAIQHDLAWLGLDWDDTIRQSGRLPLYAEAADRLRALGRLYPCFEPDEELNAKREQRQRRGQSPIYDRAMLKLTPEQRANAEAGGKRPHWRFLLSGVPAEWGDMILGRQEVKLSAVSDPVVIRADGTPLHAFTSVVDDVDMGITHVVRGADQATLTGIQIDMMAALAAGAPKRLVLPRFAHVPPMADQADRRAHPTLRSLRTDGIDPAALAGTLIALGTKQPPIAEPPAKLAPHFDLTQLSPKPPRFDIKRLLRVNRRTLQSLEFDAVRDRLPPAATPAFWTAIRGSLDLLREARGWWDVVAGTIVPPLLEDETTFLTRALEFLPPEPWDAETWPGWLATLRTETGRSGRALLLPLRLALTGEDHGPELADLLPLMGRTRVAERLKLAAA